MRSESRSCSNNLPCTPQILSVRLAPTRSHDMAKRLCDAFWYASSLSFLINSPPNFVTEEKDLVIIGGGVAGYVAAIKAGQEGLKVCYLLS